MSEFINNSSQRKELLRHMLVRLHEGESPDLLRNRLIEVLRSIPYNEVVEVEQELIDNAILSEEEILEFCDLHTAVLDGSIDLEGAKEVPAGHPVDTFKQENVALRAEIEKYYSVREQIQTIDDSQVTGFVLQLRTLFNNFSDVDKHYKRKEYLLFPYMEKHLITGPPKVMWGKHDETRAALKAAHEALSTKISTADELRSAVALLLDPVADMIGGMVMNCCRCVWILSPKRSGIRFIEKHPNSVIRSSTPKTNGSRKG